jgi:hypothetical protein
MKSINFLLAVIFLVALIGCEGCALASDSAGAKHEFCYEPCIVTLYGTMKTTWTYGPPNFGDPKTDNKVPIFVLKLDHKIDIRASELFDAAAGVSEVQLYLPEGTLALSSGRHVTVVGRLQQATTATDIYPVVMQVSSMSQRSVK